MKVKDLTYRLENIVVPDIREFDLALYIGKRRHTLSADEITIRPLSGEIAFRIKKEPRK